MISWETEHSIHTSGKRKQEALFRAGTKGTNLTRLSLMFRSWQTWLQMGQDGANSLRYINCEVHQ